MYINITEQELNNLLVLITSKGRLHLTGDEAFEFVNIVNKLTSAELVNQESVVGYEKVE